jgi:hypothetical protein
MSRTATYNALGRGDLEAVKLGGRTLLDVEVGLAWLRSLPPAQIRAPRPSDVACRNGDGAGRPIGQSAAGLRRFGRSWARSDLEANPRDEKPGAGTKR